VTFEEGTWPAWLYDLLNPQVDKPVVCNPRKNALLKDGNKSDRIDARKLAELLRGHQLKPVYHGDAGKWRFALASKATSAAVERLAAADRYHAATIDDPLRTSYFWFNSRATDRPGPPRPFVASGELRDFTGLPRAREKGSPSRRQHGKWCERT
jgi:hypothetical protein